jgi:hypothetical protein
LKKLDFLKETTMIGIGVKMLPLPSIDKVSQVAIVLHVITRCMRGHQLSILGVPKYTKQAIDQV